MSVKNSEFEPSTASSGWIFNKSHRTRPEQLVGLGIYLLIALGCEFITRIADDFWGTCYFISLGASMWFLWRRYSLRVLKLELSLFLLQFFFQGIWSLSYFLFQEPLLALVSLLLLATNTLLSGLLYWKKEPLAGLTLLLPFFWISYLSGIYMVTCMRLL